MDGAVVNVTFGRPGTERYVASAPGKIIGQIVELKSPHVIYSSAPWLEDTVIKYVAIADLPDNYISNTEQGKLVQGGGRKSRSIKKRVRRTRRN